MAKRNSEYERIADDAYYTPPWVTRVLIPHIPKRVTHIWEPAVGPKRMIARELAKAGYQVMGTDKTSGVNFLKPLSVSMMSIVTNPPYKHAQDFVERAIFLTRDRGSEIIAMLLPVDFDSAATRVHLFRDNPIFAKKIVLMRRVRWIEGSTGSPSENHAWYIFDWHHKGLPTIAYGV